MTREEAIKNIKKVLPMSKTLEDAFYTLHPELRENEDEKFRDYIIRCCEEYDNGLELSMSTTKRLLAYLKKHKSYESAKDVKEAYDWMVSRFKYFCPNLQPKQEWSKEDESFLDSIEDAISSYYDLNHAPQYHYWLEEKLKFIRLQPNPEWSDEDEHRRTDAIYFLESAKSHYADTSEVDKTIFWLKSLPLDLKKRNEDVAKLCSNEWSEEDEKKYQSIRSILLTDVDKKVGSWKYSEILEWYEKRGIGRYTNSQPRWKPSKEQKYDGNMDKECIKLCDILNSVPSIDTFESCCGHLKDRYSIWFFCDDIITISRLGRCVERNYSDGKWELLVDSTDTHPTGVFWLRSKVPFQSYDEMEKSVNGLCNNIQYWFNTKFDSNFNGDVVNQELHWKPNKENLGYPARSR